MKIKYPIVDGVNEYLLLIDSFDSKMLREVGIEDPIELYDVVLERVSGNDTSSARVLSTISSCLKVFLMDNPNAILYFYCDDMHDIARGENHQCYSPQEYRSRLFSTMFDAEKERHDGALPFVNNKIVINTSEGRAFIHLITHECNKYAAEIVSREIKSQGKDETTVTLSE